MNIEADESVFKIPSFARQAAYNFDTDRESLEIYQELNQIAEEIEKCRLRNL